ncbi:MAG TPA: GAF domain-containing protein [Thermoleophilaceae bacterium]
MGLDTHAHHVEDETRERLASLAEEQAALRRVATAVAGGAQPEEVFGLVTEEAGRLLLASSSGMIRYEPDGESALVVGRWMQGDQPGGMEVGTVVPVSGNTGVAHVLRTGQPVRIESFKGRQGWIAEEMDRLGFRGTVSAPITVGGRIWGALVVATTADEPMPPESETRLSEFADLVALALDSAQAKQELIESRARIVHAGDEARRKLERDLHDGAQQRLVSLALSLRVAADTMKSDPERGRELVDHARAELDQAIEELRELARGIHPAVLTERGLAAAVELLSSRAALPVETEITTERLPPPVEAAAYYVVAEALTNVARYSGADSATVTIDCDAGRVIVEISDDGNGGADPASGSGLRGLADRVEALNGNFEVTSPPGEGTCVRAEFADCGLRTAD